MAMIDLGLLGPNRHGHALLKFLMGSTLLDHLKISMKWLEESGDVMHIGQYELNRITQADARF